MALVACGITIWQLWREVGPLRAEVRRLRDEVGELIVDDPTKIHAIEVRQKDELTWRWRLWIPAGRTYVLRAVGEDIPKPIFPKVGARCGCEPGEMWVEYRITKDPAPARGEVNCRTREVLSAAMNMPGSNGVDGAAAGKA